MTLAFQSAGRHIAAARRPAPAAIARPLPHRALGTTRVTCAPRRRSFRGGRRRGHQLQTRTCGSQGACSPAPSMTPNMGRACPGASIDAADPMRWWQAHAARAIGYGPRLVSRSQASARQWPGAAKTRPPAAAPPCRNPHNNPYGIGEGIKGWLSKTERAHRREVEFVAMERLLALQWAILDRHFQYQIRLVGHFREVGPATVLRMWRTQTNKDGKHLSQFERAALKERYCELFGTWPQ